MAEYAVASHNIFPSGEVIWGSIKLIMTVRYLCLCTSPSVGFLVLTYSHRWQLTLSGNEYLLSIIELLEVFASNLMLDGSILQKYPNSASIQTIFCSYYLVILDNCRELLSFLKQKKKQKAQWKYIKMKSQTDQSRLDRFNILLAAAVQVEAEKVNTRERKLISLYRNEDMQYYVGEVVKDWKTILLRSVTAEPDLRGKSPRPPQYFRNEYV